jgi:hypothetical protein
MLETVQPIVYGSRSSCSIPFDLVIRGMIGCIDSAGGKYVYDASGQLLSDGAHHFSWDGVVHEDDQVTILAGHQFESNRADGSLAARMRLDGQGRPIYVEHFEIDQQQHPALRITLTWQGQRLTRVETVTDTATAEAIPVYDCPEAGRARTR